MYQHTYADTKSGIRPVFSDSIYVHFAFIHISSLPSSQKTTLSTLRGITRMEMTKCHQSFFSACILKEEFDSPPHNQ